MKVLALDIAKTATGWAVGDGIVWTFGTLKCPIHPPEGLDRNDIDAGYSGAVADWFRTNLLQIVAAHRPEQAAIEKPLPGNLTKRRVSRLPSEFWSERVVAVDTGSTAYSTTHFLHGLTIEGTSLLFRRGIPTVYVPVQKWRKTLGIHRPPKSEANPRRWYKQEAIRQCNLRGIAVDQADAAEAICLGIHHLGTLGWDQKIRVGQLV